MKIERVEIETGRWYLDLRLEVDGNMYGLRSQPYTDVRDESKYLEMLWRSGRLTERLINEGKYDEYQKRLSELAKKVEKS